MNLNKIAEALNTISKITNSASTNIGNALKSISDKVK